MNVILCATRGGEASIKTQQRAIEIAKERGAKIIFLFVSDVRFLSAFSAPHVPAMEDEMEHLGEFLLLMAKERAEKAGVEADSVVRRGFFRAALTEVAQENEVSLIILGRPGEKGLTTLEYLEKELLPAIQEDTGIETILA